MSIFAIDPGTIESAFVRLDPEAMRLLEHGRVGNSDLLTKLRLGRPWRDVVAIEMIASYGMAVGREVFETCVWIGRFEEAVRGPVRRIYRREVKLHLCGSVRAKDPNVRTALLDRWGGKEQAVGTKARPGPLRGVTRDCWAALGVALTCAADEGEAPVSFEEDEAALERESLLLMERVLELRKPNRV